MSAASSVAIPTQKTIETYIYIYTYNIYIWGVTWVPLAGSISSATRNCALVKRTMCLIDGSEGGGACAKISFISSLASSVFEPQCLQPSTDTISVSPPSVCNMQRAGIRNGNPESLEIRYSDRFNKEVMACG